MLGDQVFWVVCAIFYVIDNVRRLEARRLILVEGARGGWMPLFPLRGYRMGHRPLVLLNLLTPWQAAVRMDVLTVDGWAPRTQRRAARRLRVYAARLLPFRILSSMLFVLLFVAGPAATHRLGLGHTLVLFLPLHLIAFAAAATLLVAQRRFWRMRWTELAGLAFECALCPGFFVNICRKVSLRHAHVPGDALAVALARDGARAASDIAPRWETYVDDLRDYDELMAGDELLIAKYRQRLIEAGASAQR